MFGKALARRLSRIGIHYGWVMVALAFLTTICWSVAVSLPGILIVPITEEFGWSKADVSGAVAMMFVLFACVVPFSGALMLRYGVVSVVTVSAALVVAGLLATTLVTAKWHLNVSIGLLVGIAAGMLGLSLTATIASRWFVARRGLVVGILTAAFAAGQLAFLPIAAWLSTAYGWRMAIAPALICAVICVVLFLLLGRDWPADVDLPPYGEERIAPPPTASAAGAISLSLTTLKEAGAIPFFWLLAGTFFVCGLSSTGIVNQHFVPFCADYNIGAVVATSYLAIMGVFNFVGTIGSGWLTDRFDNRMLLASYYGLRGLLLIWLPFSDFDVMALTVWAIFFGLDFVATVPPTVKLAGQYFGAAKGPVLFGWIYAAHQLGSAAAAYGSGVTRDSVLSYLPAFVAAGIVCFVTVAFIAAIRTPARPAAA